MDPPSIVIKAPEEIERVNELIHDRLFRTSDVVFERLARVVTIPFAPEDHDAAEIVSRSFFIRRPRKWRIPLKRSFLRIHHVREFSVEDGADVGTQEFNELRYEAGIRSVVVESCVPVTITAAVDRFEVEVEETLEALGTRTIASFLVLGEVSRNAIEPLEETR